jgi:hypothetical protein
MKIEAAARVRPWVSSTLQRFSLSRKPATADLLLGAVLALAAIVITLLMYRQVSPYILHYSTWDFWFESDPARTVYEATDRHSTYHSATSHHPLFSLIIFPPVFVLATLLKLGAVTAFGIVLAATSALSVSVTYATLRILGLERADAFIFTSLMAVSAAAVFWFPVPETWGLGALSILIVIGVCALSERNNGLPMWAYFLASVAALSVTTTNWLVALAMLFVFLDQRAAIEQAVKSFLLVMAMWALQYSFFPQSVPFLKITGPAEVDYVFNAESHGVLAKLYGFFFHSIVIPDIVTAYGFRLSVQGSLPGAGSLLAVAATVAWAALLALGCWGAIRLLTGRTTLQFSKTVTVLLLAIAGQLVVTIVFGLESFLYSLHFAPLLIMLAGLSALTPARRIAVPLAAALAIMAAFNNFQKFATAAEQLAGRYEHEQQFAALLAEKTDPKALLLCGGEALGATGEGGKSRPKPSEAPIGPINSQDDPDTCSFMFDAEFDARQGWMVPYEDWSLEAFQTFAQRGAGYFVTSYAYGLEKRQPLFDQLDRNFRTITRTPDWAIYDLQSPPGSAGDNSKPPQNLQLPERSARVAQ